MLWASSLFSMGCASTPFFPMKLTMLLAIMALTWLAAAAHIERRAELDAGTSEQSWHNRAELVAQAMAFKARAKGPRGLWSLTKV